MLRFFRKRATGIMVKGLFFMIIVVFIFWGIGTVGTREEVVAEVGKRKITLSEYKEEQKRLYDFFRSLYGDRFDEKTVGDLKIEERALDNLIDRSIILNLSESLGIKISGREYMDHLASVDAFKKEGVFSKERFLEVLKGLNLDPKAFEERERSSLTLEKMRGILQDLLVLPDEEMILDECRKELGFVRLAYNSFDPKDFIGRVSIDEREVDLRVEKERGLHLSPERYRLRYIILHRDSSLRDDKVYMELIKKKDMKSYANEANLKIFETALLSEKELSDTFGDIKDFSWLKDLRVNDISLPVRTDRRSYIFQLLERKGGEPLKEEEIRRMLKERIRLEKAKDYARKEALRFIESKERSFQKSTVFISRKSSDIPGLGEIPKEDLGILNLSKKEEIYGRPVEIGGKFYVFGFLEERLPDRIPEGFRIYAFEKIRDEAMRKFLETMRKREKIEIHLKGT